MANVRGFVPSKKIGGGDYVTARFPVSCPAAAGMFLNDLVVADADGKAMPYDATKRPLGVVVSLYGSDGRELTFNQPDGGVYLPAGSTGFADVIIDTGVIFVASTNTTAASTAVYGNINVSAGTGNTATGLSGHQLNTSSVSTSADLPFKIIGGAPNDSKQLGSATDGFGSGMQLQVVLNNTLLNSGTAGV